MSVPLQSVRKISRRGLLWQVHIKFAIETFHQNTACQKAPIMTVTPKHRAPWSGLDTSAPDAKVGILGIPFDGSASFRKGAAHAPTKIRAMSHHVDRITEEGMLLTDMTVCDYGDVARDLNWERYFASVQDAATQALTHSFALFIGGDHSVTIPLHAAYAAQHGTEKIGVIQLDAHTDLMSSFEGHPWSHACTARRAIDDLGIAPAHYTFIGIRSYVEEEVHYLADNGDIVVHSARDSHLRGIETITQAAIQQLSHLDHIYLSLDIDCLDPAFAPGTGTPEAAGLSTRDLLTCLRMLFAALPITAMDIVEVAPPLDTSDITSAAALKVIYEVLGWL